MAPPLCPACRKPRTAGTSCPHCGQTDKNPSQTSALTGSLPTASPAAEGPSRLGHYRLLRELGRGGMGRVLEAVDESLGRHVAVKVLLRSEGAMDPRRLRFIEEARIAGCLEHPGIAPVYTRGRGADGSEFFSMKLVAGRDLSDILDGRRKGDRDLLRDFPLSRLLSIFERVVETIAYAHSQGVLHRDLKPANIMVGGHGEVWVIDWGLAKNIGQAELSTVLSAPVADSAVARDATVAGSIVGTPSYMAPEQAKGHALDARTDVFGLGAILYKMLTGQAPNQGPDHLGTLMNAALGEVTPVRLTPDGRRAPKAVAAIAMKCLALAPEDRYTSADELLADLRAYAAGNAVRALPDGFRGKVFRLARRHHRLALAAGFSLALLLVAATLTFGAIAAKDRQALDAERKAQAAEAERQAAVAESAERAQRRMKAFAPYAEATDLIARGQELKTAVEKLEDSLRIDPDFPEAQFALGEAFRLNGQPGRAAPAYLKAHEMSQRITGRPHVQALLAAGMTYDGAGEYNQSNAAFLQAEREGADHPLALVGKAFRLTGRCQIHEAQVAAEEALKRAPHLWETSFAAGFVLEEKVRLGFLSPEPHRRRAIELLRKARELSPRQAETYIWLGNALGQMPSREDVAESMRNFDKAVELEPANGNRYLSRGAARLSLGDPQGAAADYDKARELGVSRAQRIVMELELAAQRREDEKVLRLYDDLIAERQGWPGGIVGKYGVALRLHREKEVQTAFDDCCRENPQFPDSYATRAVRKLRDGDAAGAVAEDVAGLKVTPFNRRLLTQRAVHLMAVRQWKECLTAADAALEVAPNDITSRVTRVWALAGLGRLDEANAALDAILKDFPNRAKELEEVRTKLAALKK